MKSPKPSVERQVDTRADLDRAETIYSLEFSEAEIDALRGGVVPETVRQMIETVQKTFTRTGEPELTPASQLPRQPTKVTR